MNKKIVIFSALWCLALVAEVSAMANRLGTAAVRAGRQAAKIIKPGEQPALSPTRIIRPGEQNVMQGPIRTSVGPVAQPSSILTAPTKPSSLMQNISQGLKPAFKPQFTPKSHVMLPTQAETQIANDLLRAENAQKMWRGLQQAEMQEMNLLQTIGEDIARTAKEAAIKRTAEIRGNTVDEVARLAREAALKRGLVDSAERKVLQQASDAQFKGVDKAIKTAAKKAEKGKKSLESWKAQAKAFANGAKVEAHGAARLAVRQQASAEIRNNTAKEVARLAEEAAARRATENILKQSEDLVIARRKDFGSKLADQIEQGAHRSWEQGGQQMFMGDAGVVARDLALGEALASSLRQAKQPLREVAQEVAQIAKSQGPEAAREALRNAPLSGQDMVTLAALLGMGGLVAATVNDQIQTSRENAAIAAADRAAIEAQLMASGNAALAAIDVSKALEIMNNNPIQSPEYQAAQQMIAGVMDDASPDVRSQIQAAVDADAARVAQAVAAGLEATQDEQEWAAEDFLQRQAVPQQGWTDWAKEKASNVYQSLPGFGVPSGVSNWATSVYQSLPSVGVPSAVSNWWAGAAKGQEAGSVVQGPQQPSGLDTLREYGSRVGSAIGGEVQDTLVGLHGAIQGVARAQAARELANPNSAASQRLRQQRQEAIDKSYRQILQGPAK